MKSTPKPLIALSVSSLVNEYALVTLCAESCIVLIADAQSSKRSLNIELSSVTKAYEPGNKTLSNKTDKSSLAFKAVWTTVSSSG